MEDIRNSKNYRAGIFAYLLSHPEKVSELNFRSEYIEPSTSSDYEHYYKLFDPCYRLAYNKNVPYNKEMLYTAMFQSIRPDLNEVFLNPDVEDVHAKQEMTQIKSLLDSEYNYSLEISQTLGNDFVHDLIVQLVHQQAPFRIYMELGAKFHTMSIEDVSAEEFDFGFRSELEKLTEKYPSPDTSTSSYISPFDPSLLVKITDKRFTCSSVELNTLLGGGFTSQSVCGFLTKTAGGKSTFLFTLSSDFIRKGYNVCFVNLEMNDYETNARILSGVCDVPYKELLENLQNQDYMQDVRAKWDNVALGEYALLSNRGSDSGYTDCDWLKRRVKMLEKKIRYTKKKDDFKFDILIIDYLFLMEPKRTLLKTTLKDYEKYKRTTVEVHNFAQNEDYCVITVFQGNREAERKMSAGEKIGLADAGDSYGAFRDIEYAFVLTRYTDLLNGKDGCLIESQKNRNHDGEKYGIYMPYVSRTMSYNLSESERLDVSYIDDKDAKPKRVKNVDKPLSVMDVLKADPTIQNLVGGCIYNAMVASKLVRVKGINEITDAFAELGWRKPATKKDFKTEPDYDKMKAQVADAIKKALVLKNETPGKPVLGLVTDVNNTLFDMTDYE